jgi:hypothetical protein
MPCRIVVMVARQLNGWDLDDLPSMFGGVVNIPRANMELPGHVAAYGAGAIIGGWRWASVAQI